MITSLIVAASRNDVIGAGGTLPWYLPEDLRRFRRLTTGHAVVVGRLTHESILARLGRSLPNRTSMVVSSEAGGSEAVGSGAGESGAVSSEVVGSGAVSSGAGESGGGVMWFPSLDAAMSAALSAEAGAGRGGRGESNGGPGQGSGEIFVIGGASIYQQALSLADKIYLTRVHRDVEGDTRMPTGWLDGFELVARDDRAARGPDGGYSWLDYLREPS